MGVVGLHERALADFDLTYKGYQLTGRNNKEWERKQRELWLLLLPLAQTDSTRIYLMEEGAIESSQIAERAKRRRRIE